MPEQKIDAQPKQQPLPHGKHVAVYRLHDEVCTIRTSYYLFRIQHGRQASLAHRGTEGDYELAAVKKLPVFMSMAPLNESPGLRDGSIIYVVEGSQAYSFDLFPKPRAGKVRGLGSYLELLADQDMKRTLGIREFSSTCEGDASPSRCKQLSIGGLRPGEYHPAEDWMRGIAKVVERAKGRHCLKVSVEKLLKQEFARLASLASLSGAFEKAAGLAVQAAGRRGKLQALRLFVDERLQVKSSSQEATAPS
jgi:hypothetical protein